MARSEDTHRWQSRPVLANALRALLLAVPLATSVGAVTLLGRALPPDVTRTWWGIALLFSVAVVVAVVVERSARRLLPLAVLLKLTMVFPDRAPSRLKVARAASMRTDEVVRTGPDSEPRTTSEVVLSLVAALGAHDRKTRGHSERVRVLCDMLAEELKLDAPARDRLRWASLLHDVGKMRVSTAILNKPAKLNATEFDAIKAHPDAGAVLVGPLLPWLGEWGRGIAEHHEKFDGSGYPRGLTSTGISQAGRLIAVVDAFETMTAARPYKKAMATRAAREELARCAGTHFDPVYVRAFLAVSLPRLLWAMGPLSFLFQLPFLRSLAEAGARTGAATGQAAVQAAGAAAMATAGVAVVGVAVTGGGLPGDQRPQPVQLAVAQGVVPSPAPAASGAQPATTRVRAGDAAVVAEPAPRQAPAPVAASTERAARRSTPRPVTDAGTTTTPQRPRGGRRTTTSTTTTTTPATTTPATSGAGSGASVPVAAPAGIPGPTATPEPVPTTDASPSATAAPTTAAPATAEPVVAASPAPTAEPVVAASPAPTAEPTVAASPAPTAEPTLAASPAPTAEPTLAAGSPVPTASPATDVVVPPAVVDPATPAPTVPPSPTAVPAPEPVGPQPPVIAAGPDGNTTEHTVTFVFASPTALAYECQQLDPGARLTPGGWVTCESPVTYTHLHNGNHEFWVRAVDASGPGEAAVRRFRVTSGSDLRTYDPTVQALRGVLHRTHPLLERALTSHVARSWIRHLLGR